MSLNDTYKALNDAQQELKAMGYDYDYDAHCWVDAQEQNVDREQMDTIIDEVAQKHLGHSLPWSDTLG